MHALVRGAIAGAVATVPMTLMMLGLFRRLPASQQYPLPPTLITADIAARTGVRPVVHGQMLALSALTAHFAYGAVTGAIYPLLENRRTASTAFGASYGLAVWAASYLGWIPAMRILTPASRHPAKRNALMLTAHVVWGAALAGTSRLLSRHSNETRRRERLAQAV